MISLYQNKPYFKVFIKILSVLIQVASLSYLSIVLLKYGDLFLNKTVEYSFVWYILFQFILLYSIILIFPALGWMKILDHHSNDKIKFPDILWLYYRTSIAKYIPGNIFHYVSRQIQGHKFGWGQKAMGVASFTEILFVMSAGGLLSLLSYPFIDLPEDLVSIPNAIFVLIIIIIFVAPWAVLFGASKITSTKSVSFPSESLYHNDVLLGYLSYVVFLVLSALLFAAVLFVSGLSLNDSLYGIFIYGFIYVISYITPGAPGGIGVREALFVLFLAEVIPSGEAVSIAIIYRVITICGELFCFGLTFFFGSQKIKLT